MDTTEALDQLNEFPPLVHINTLLKEHADFDYGSVKKLYFQELEYIDNTNLLSTKLLWNRHLLYNKILQIKMTPTTHIKHEVITVLGEDWLIRKRSSETCPIVRILSSEYCFDIIAKAHIETNHGNSKITASVIDPNFIYPKFCIPIVLKYCNVCSASSHGINKDKKITWYLSIADVTRTKEIFNYVLVYIEKNSEYTLLRPLMSKSIDEVSLELFKIFSVFGAPKKLFTSRDLLDFVKTVVAKVKPICPQLNVQVFAMRSSVHVLKMKITTVILALNSWMKETGCKKWEIGCHIVQWKINTTRKILTSFNTNDFVIDIPYENFFGQQVNVFNYVSSSEIPGYSADRIQNVNDPGVDESAESSIVEIKSVYTICHLCYRNVFVQYKCSICQKPIHSECGIIMRNNLRNRFIHTVICKTCSR